MLVFHGNRECFGLQHVLAWVTIQIKLKENLAIGNKSNFFN